MRRDHADTLRRRFLRGERLSNADVQEALEVVERQARRILAELAKADPPLREYQEGRRKLYGYAPEDQASGSFQVELSEDEALALAFAAEAARTALEPTPLAEPLRRAASRLFTAADVLSFEPEDTPSLVRFSGDTGADVAPAVFRAVWEAVSERCALTISYVNAKGERSQDRRVDPYGLVVARGSWTLVAHDYRQDQVAHFALPAIESADVGEPHGGPPDDFDLEQHLRDAFGAFAATDGEVETIRLEVSPAAASSFRRKRYHPTQLIEEERVDGSLVVSMEAAPAPDLEAFVRSFGPAVRVIEPAALADRIALAARKVAELYDGQERR